MDFFNKTRPVQLRKIQEMSQRINFSKCDKIFMILGRIWGVGGLTLRFRLFNKLWILIATLHHTDGQATQSTDPVIYL